MILDKWHTFASIFSPIFKRKHIACSKKDVAKIQKDTANKTRYLEKRSTFHFLSKYIYSCNIWVSVWKQNCILHIAVQLKIAVAAFHTDCTSIFIWNGFSRRLGPKDSNARLTYPATNNLLPNKIPNALMITITFFLHNKNGLMGHHLLSLQLN